MAPAKFVQTKVLTSKFVQGNDLAVDSMLTNDVAHKSKSSDLVGSELSLATNFIIQD